MSPVGSASRCPDCDVPYNTDSWTNSPLPCPFVEQINAKCAIVIKPTTGYFTSYKIGDDLHIGISDSHAVVHSYWTNGVTAQATSWDKSILVFDFGHLFSTDCWFDQSLFTYIRDAADRFKSEGYNDIEWNCFDFVLEFLRYIKYRDYTKVHFVSEFVQDVLKNATKYCSLVGKVQEKGFIMIG